MGSSTWSHDFYADREAARKRSGTDAFAHNHSIKEGKAKREVHAKMNPMDIRRESRDSEAHPNSIAVGVVLDVTGSLLNNPRVIQADLPRLNDNLKGVIDDAQILFSAVGDAHCDNGSLQVGQFEAGIEQDDDLGRFWLEGGGGGNDGESYELALYWFARHTSIDCMEKRNKRGYIFIIGDEKPLPYVEPGQVRKIIGAKLDKQIPVEDIVKECQQKYNIFFLIPDGSSHSNDTSMENRWKELLGAEHVFHIRSQETSDVIAHQIGICEGKAKKTDKPAVGVTLL